MPKFDTSWIAASKIPAPRKNVRRSHRLSLAFPARVTEALNRTGGHKYSQMVVYSGAATPCAERLSKQGFLHRLLMITRRFLLAISPAAILGLRASAFTPGDSWSSKQPEDWSEKDIHQILTKSPWAKTGASRFRRLERRPAWPVPQGAVLQAVESGGPPGGRRSPPGGGPPGGGPPGGGIWRRSRLDTRSWMIVVRWDFPRFPIRLCLQEFAGTRRGIL